MWKYILVFFAIISLGTIGVIAYNLNKDLNNAGIDTGLEINSPFVKKVSDDEEHANNDDFWPIGRPINIVLLGIDRRSREEFGYRTDTMILLSINPDDNQVVLTSIPRDLWWNGGRINAVFNGYGWEETQKAIETMTGQRPERFILTDFKDFSWVIDAMGGVPVTVEKSFTDTLYPVDETKGYQTIKFTAGKELLTGERALIYARSRKGDNGEGSDWMRMKRQHLILKGMLEAVISPKSIFNPMVVEKAFTTVTTGKMDTNLELSDAQYLWDFFKDKDLYEFESLYLDGTFLYNPPLEEYGGAWVLVPTGGSYKEFHDVLHNALYNIENEPVVEVDDSF